MLRADPPIFVRLIDISLVFLFNWTNVNISLNQKIAAYSHLYSFTSVKSVVHWYVLAYHLVKNGPTDS